jgi:preprotein translocase subunit SecE
VASINGNQKAGVPMALNQQQKAKAGGSGNSGSTPMDLPKTRGGLKKVIQETMVELKKTTWPTKQEATRLTTVVVGVIVVMGLYMGALDMILSFIVKRFSLIK